MNDRCEYRRNQTQNRKAPNLSAVDPLFSFFGTSRASSRDCYLTQYRGLCRGPVFYLQMRPEASEEVSRSKAVRNSRSWDESRPAADISFLTSLQPSPIGGLFTIDGATCFARGRAPARERKEVDNVQADDLRHLIMS